MFSTDELKQLKEVVNTAIEPLQQDIQTLKSNVQELQQTSTGTKQDIQILKTGVTSLYQTTTATQRDIRTMKKDITKIRESQNEIIGFFDNNYVELRTRVERIEEVLDLS